jgi:hypothetical protein
VRGPAGHVERVAGAQDPLDAVDACGQLALVDDEVLVLVGVAVRQRLLGAAAGIPDRLDLEQVGREDRDGQVLVVGEAEDVAGRGNRRAPFIDRAG